MLPRILQYSEYIWLHYPTTCGVTLRWQSAFTGHPTTTRMDLAMCVHHQNNWNKHPITNKVHHIWWIVLIGSKEYQRFRNIQMKFLSFLDNQRLCKKGNWGSRALRVAHGNVYFILLNKMKQWQKHVEIVQNETRENSFENRHQITAVLPNEIIFSPCPSKERKYHLWGICVQELQRTRTHTEPRRK